MNGVKSILLKKIAKTAYGTAKIEVDSACFCFFYQPVMTEKVKSLKKRK
ncbi:MAG: cyclic lactone autoinducer peptide [Lachnospiraceae bacterium]|nr:cyclic lactone autoinducer peptide [Lachnospiraceae bacterium]